MKNLIEMTAEVLKIKSENFLMTDRERALNTAGYNLRFMSTEDAKEIRTKGGFAQSIACSRDWNRTFGYAVKN